MAAAVGTLGKLGIGASSPVDYALDFRSEGIQRKDDPVNGNGVRATRSHHVARVRAGPIKIAGPLMTQPNAADLHRLLPWALCGTTSTVSGTRKRYKLGESAALRYVTVDRVAKVFTYQDAGVDRLTLKADQGQLLEANLDLVARVETVGNAGTFPSLEVDATTNPFILSDIALTVNGTSVNGKGFEVTVENFIDPDRFLFSNTLSAIVMRDREVRFKTQITYGDHATLYNLGAGTGVAVVATLTNGSVLLYLTMPAVVIPPASPLIPGREEVMMDLEGRAYRTGASTDDTGLELTAEVDTGA